MASLFSFKRCHRAGVGGKEGGVRATGLLSSCTRSSIHPSHPPNSSSSPLRPPPFFFGSTFYLVYLVVHSRGKGGEDYRFIVRLHKLEREREAPSIHSSHPPISSSSTWYLWLKREYVVWWLEVFYESSLSSSEARYQGDRFIVRLHKERGREAPCIHPFLSYPNKNTKI